jgi:hypothetical protein
MANLLPIQTVYVAETPIFPKTYLVFSWFCLLAKGVVRTMPFYFAPSLPLTPKGEPIAVYSLVFVIRRVGMA